MCVFEVQDCTLHYYNFDKLNRYFDYESRSVVWFPSRNTIAAACSSRFLLSSVDESEKHMLYDNPDGVSSNGIIGWVGFHNDRDWQVLSASHGRHYMIHVRCMRIRVQSRPLD